MGPRNPSRLSSRRPGSERTGSERTGVRRAAVSVVLLCWLALHFVPQAHADRPPSCEQDAACWKELNRASKLAESGQYAEALSVFEAAYARVPDPRLQINIGRSLHRLGRYDDAVAAFQQYQATARASAPPQEQEVVRRFIAEAQLAKLQASQPQAQPPPPPAEKPIYKKWWFWTLVGGVVVGGVVAGVVVGTWPRTPSEEEAERIRFGLTLAF